MIPLRGALRRSGFFVAAAALAIGAAVALAPKQPMASASSSGWVETWAAAPMKPTREVINRATAGFTDTTIRNVAPAVLDAGWSRSSFLRVGQYA